VAGILTTDSVDEKNCCSIARAQSLHKLEIPFVSVGHRSMLKELHDHLIILNSQDGTVRISESSRTAKAD